jgi:hypothetical protein
VTFSPTKAAYVKTRMELKLTAPELPPALVEIEATSLDGFALSIDPEGLLDFGLVPKGKQRVVTRNLVNRGGAPVEITALKLDDPSGNLGVSLPDLPVQVPPLGKVPVRLTLQGNRPGEVSSKLLLQLTGVDAKPLEQEILQLKGTVTEPRLTLNPGTLDLGTVPVGWAVTRQVELRNSGFGPLTVKNVRMVGGSSTLFTINRTPSLPLTLERDQRVSVEVHFRAEAAATFQGWLTVESDDAARNFAELEMKATVGSCEAGCPIANGKPVCNGGKCGVGSCNAGFHDTDKKADNGCECQEVGADPGPFCPSSIYLGVLRDNNKQQANHVGIVPVADDVDLIRFYAEDAFKLFDEDFNVKIRLTSNDPGIRFCVYRHGSGGHDNECYFKDEACPGNLYFNKTGGGTREDGADFIVKVFRDPQSAPTCGQYTLFMSNGL